MNIGDKVVVYQEATITGIRRNGYGTLSFTLSFEKDGKCVGAADVNEEIVESADVLKPSGNSTQINQVA